MNIIITSPSLNPKENVSGISSVTQFIISNNRKQNYLHFELGKKDLDKGGWHRIPALIKKYKEWKKMLALHPDAIIHYNFPLSKPSLLRDPWFMRYAWKKGRKMVVHVHGGLFLTAPHIPGFLMRIMKWVFGQDLPFIVLSDMEKDILTQGFGAKNVVSLPNCVDLSDAAAFEKEQVLHDESQPLRIGYLGRIEPNKGMTELLVACQRLKKEKYPLNSLSLVRNKRKGSIFRSLTRGWGIALNMLVWFLVNRSVISLEVWMSLFFLLILKVYQCRF